MENRDSLLPGPDTFTLERVERQLRIDTFAGDPGTCGGTPFPFICWSLEYSREDGTHRYYTKEKQETLRESYCRKLYSEASDVKGHVERLDSLFCELVVCNFPRQVRQRNMPSNAWPSPGQEWPHTESRDLVIEACDLLSRLPAVPLELPHDGPVIDLAYYKKMEPHDETSQSRGWQYLQMVSYTTTNVIRVALMVAMYRMTSTGTMLDSFINTTADLMSTASRLSTLAGPGDEKVRWFLVRVFLWTSWQRSSMLYFYSILSGHILHGFDDHLGHEIVLRGFSPSPGMSIQEMSKHYASQEKPAYMCGWAFELLRTDPCAIGSDFRRFHQSFSRPFGSLSGRCVPGHDASCRGTRPDSCQRFKGMRIENQSMHHGDCQGNCRRLTWDEASYRKVSGARAVDINVNFLQTQVKYHWSSEQAYAISRGLKVHFPDGTRLKYCEASDQTLAISHVWSHGQGGRPEVGHGMNRCLHRRYTSIAKSLGCDSYWMDTPCIPEDHQLRKEAILNINKIFEQSKATLVCDRDLMSIDASSVTIQVRETILVTAMVCDWNLRAWTFLEAFRGRNNIYVLCKDDVVVSLKETVEIVYHKGCIETALLLLTIPHLLPAFHKRDMRTAGNAFVSGFMTVEESGTLLSHREASRPGDDLVIWSLLLDDKVHSNAKAFWISREGQILRTSFLLSSAPRLKTPGLRWAPSSPAAQILGNESTNSAYRLLAFDGHESEVGLISKDGFHAEWLMHDLTGGLKGSKAICSKFVLEISQPEDDHCGRNLSRIRERFLKGYVWAALLRPVATQTYQDPAMYRGDASKTLLAVCAINNLKIVQWPWEKDGTIFWTWLGVYEWDTTEPLPKFTLTKDVCVV